MPLRSFYLYVKAHVVEWCQHYIHFSKVLLFLLGLAVAHGLVKNSVLDVLMLYLTDDDWGNPSLKTAAAIINTEEAISGVIAFIIAILTHVWVGRFKMVVSTTASFVLGLWLLWLSRLLPLEVKHRIFYVALVLIAVGKAGKVPPFKDFIGDQIIGKDDEQVEDRTTFWWRVTGVESVKNKIYRTRRL